MNDITWLALRREHLPLLQRWLSEPHVDQWWRTPLDLAGVEAKYLPCIEGRQPTHHFLAELDGRPIGLVQWYRWDDYAEHAALLGAEPGTAGIDLFIGEPDAIGRGSGSRIIDAFVREIVFAHPDITACLSDPEEANVRSVRAFERAGFRVVRRVTPPGARGPECVVRRDR